MLSPILGAEPALNHLSRFRGPPHKPKPPFRPIFQVATTKEGSGVLLMKEPPDSDPEAPCLWWRRGRVELPVQRKPPDGLYRLSWLFSCPPGGSQLHYWGASRVFLWCPLPAWGTPHLSFRRPSPAPEGGRGRRGNLVRPPERKLFRRLSFCHRISQVMAPGPAPFGPLPLSNPSSPRFYSTPPSR